MPTCPRCDAFITSVDSANGDCPQCHAAEHEARDARHGDWRSAAKVTNLAEAGYLVSRLAGEGIEARLFQSESFSAMNGSWSSTYVLQVPATMLEDAGEILRSEAEEFEREQPEYDSFGEPIDDEPVHLVFWRPVALMAVAGLATLWLGQRVADPRPRVAPHRSAAALGAAMEAVGKPFVVTTDAGRVYHRLRYHSGNRTWYLESDTDGDGRLDRHQRFVLEQSDR
jgi:hypothetical protein